MSFYSLTYSANGITTSSLSEVILSSGTIISGSAAIVPKALAYTTFSFQQMFELQAPAGDITVGGPVQAGSDNVIAGTITVAPPINVAVTVQLWGPNGVYDTYTLNAGEEQGLFSWSVAGKQGFPDSNDDALTSALPQAKR